ncbi:MAG TPA: alkaline phosphatase family protein [Polyangia bacterium]|nr:alkaline phosphatase family protein [Polyangia bacterium]
MLTRSRFLLALLLLVGATAFKPSTPPRQRSAILISWDGALREHINDSLKRNQMPNLAQLIKEGRMVDIEVSGHVTDTRSGHAQMLTGYDPSVTGVVSNTIFRPIPLGISIFERLQQAFGKKDIATVMVTGKAMGLGPGGPRVPAEMEAASPGANEASDEDAKQARRVEKIRASSEQNVLGQPFHLVKGTLTAWDGDMPRDARAVGQKALSLIDKFGPKGRFFLFVHFGDADVNGHKYGESSREYDGALVSLDTWLGRMVAQLKTDGLYDHTAVYVTADHGFDVGTTHHGKATHIFLAGNDPQLTSAGEQRDITPTVLQAMGVDISTITPALPGKSLRK